MANYSLEIFSLGPIDTNCTILRNLKTKKAVIFDPGFAPEYAIASLEQNPDYELSRIWLTHAHWDHLGGVGKVIEAFPDKKIPLHLHSADEPLYRRIDEQVSAYGLPPVSLPSEFERLKTSDVFEEFPGAKILHTPGHSPGSVSLYVDEEYELSGPSNLLGAVSKSGKGFLISGDLLFMGSAGRTDLWQGSYEDLKTSIQTKVYTLPPDTLVITGHGPLTTVQNEAKHNQVVSSSS